LDRKQKVAGEWRQLLKEKLRNFSHHKFKLLCFSKYSLDFLIKKVKMGEMLAWNRINRRLYPERLKKEIVGTCKI
jgi:hypothetical protein